MKCPRCGGNGFVDTECFLCGYYEFKVVEPEPTEEPISFEGKEIIPKAWGTRKPLTEEKKAELKAYKAAWFEKKKQDPVWWEEFKRKNRERKKRWYEKMKQSGDLF